MPYFSCSHSMPRPQGAVSHARKNICFSQFSVEGDSLSDANHENPIVTLKGPFHLVSTTYYTPSSFKKSTLDSVLLMPCH